MVNYDNILYRFYKQDFTRRIDERIRSCAMIFGRFVPLYNEWDELNENEKNDKTGKTVDLLPNEWPYPYLEIGDFIQKEFHFYSNSSITTIPDHCFKLTKLQSTFELPFTITSIGALAFSQSNLQSIFFPPNLQSIGSRAFQLTEITSIVLPDTVTSIGVYCFWRCHKLTEVILSHGLQTIDPTVFKNCDKIQKITGPKHLLTTENFPYLKPQVLQDAIDADASFLLK